MQTTQTPIYPGVSLKFDVLSLRLHLSYTLLMRTFVANLSIANSTTPAIVKRHQGPYLLEFFVGFTDALYVCTDVEFDVSGICVRLSTLSESSLGQSKETSHSMNACDRYFLVPR